MDFNNWQWSTWISLKLQNSINEKIKIESQGNVESLNASIAGGILLNELTKKN